MKEIVVSLDGEVHDSLAMAANRNGRTIGEEAASRLVASLKADETVVSGVESVSASPASVESGEAMGGEVKSDEVKSGKVVSDGEKAGGAIDLDEKTLVRYVKRRLKGDEPADIAVRLGCDESLLGRFDEFIRETRAQWNRVYFKVRESFDPLTWEMKYMDKFHEFWGEEP